MARKVYNYYKNYPQFSSSIGGFDPKLFDITEVKKEDIVEILERRKDYTIYFDDFERLMDNPIENVGVIFKLIHKYSRDGAFLVELVTAKPGSQPKILDTIFKEINDELKDDMAARDTFKDFKWILKNMKLAMIGYVQEAIKSSFNGASTGTPQKPKQEHNQTELDKPHPSKCGGAFVDPPGCG